MKFAFTVGEIVSSLHDHLVRERDLPMDAIWKDGNSQTEPFLVGKVEFSYGDLYVLLDQQLGEYPAYLIYAYGGMSKLFDQRYMSSLRGFIPRHAIPGQRPECESNWWVEFTQEGENDHIGLVLPMKSIYLVVGNHKALVWHRV